MKTFFLYATFLLTLVLAGVSVASADSPVLTLKTYQKSYIRMKDYADCGYDRYTFSSLLCFNDQCVRDLNLELRGDELFLRTEKTDIFLGRATSPKVKEMEIRRCEIMYPYTNKQIVTNQETTYEIQLSDEMKIKKFTHDVTKKIIMGVNDLGANIITRRWMSLLNVNLRSPENTIKIKGKMTLYGDQSHNPSVPRTHNLFELKIK
jgi:hypothetical protein